MRLGVGIVIVVAVLFAMTIYMLPRRPISPGCYYTGMGEAGGWVQVLRCDR